MSLRSLWLLAIVMIVIPVNQTMAQPGPRPELVNFIVSEGAALPVFDTREEMVVAYYGHPNSRYMGIVGRHTVEELVDLVKATAREYQDLAPDRKVIPAIYLIYGTVQPEGRIGYLSDARVNEYISYAGVHGVQIILDHQIGTYTLQRAVDRLLPYLKHPHVHMAFDVEWRTSRPMEEIGSITGEELNWMQHYVSTYLQANQVRENKYIVFHQFKPSMVRGSGNILTGFPQIELIHSTSGWGSPGLKRSTHAANATLTQLPSKGFKLWYYYSDKPGIHYDKPLMTPTEVLSLNPLPRMIIYQ
jgi:hypothetical protein